MSSTRATRSPARRRRGIRQDPGPDPDAVAARRSPYAAPPTRRLRGYAFDPSLSRVLATAAVNEACFEVPWEHLTPGPVGEYLEVVDHDPASGCFYEPVDLDDPHVLAQDGLTPSDGDPRFHQQMVYAVAMRTVKAFERALGRVSFWAPGPGEHARDDGHFVRRLRIHPHALRQANAYYSPAKVALLFGYFPADPASDVHVPGGTVFSCLSHDIVAHETTHALLDGMHRRYRQPSNLDTLAFHEAFADVVALFQHFTLPEIVRQQVFAARGDLRAENLLGELAWEFGRATGGRGALRSAIGDVDRETGEWRAARPDPAAYRTTLEPHRRGSILVAAMFDAFLSIYGARTADLLRLATGGSGVLPVGAISHDLAGRLAAEAAKSANHVLTMAIRALDYCPPVDLTFGEYLRALVTADCEVFPSDQRDYRIAVAQAFRRRGIFAEGVRTMSIDSLCWKPPEELPPYRRPELGSVLKTLRAHAQEHAFGADRQVLFDRARDARRVLHQRLEAHFKTQAGRRDAECLHLADPAERRFEVHSLRVAERVGPDRTTLPQMIIELTQRLDAGTPDEFEGGCTLVVDLQQLEVRYCIYKDLTSDERRARQRAFRQSFVGDALWSTYFSDAGSAAREPFRLLHRRSFEVADGQ